MKKINYIKFSLDVVLALLFVLFFNKRVLGGQPFHEIAGLVFAVMYFTHILLNWKWVVNVTGKLFDRKLPWKTRGSYALNLLLLISMSFVIISGILISKVVFPNIHVANQMWFRVTHISVSFLVLVLVGIHVGLHWQWVVNVWKKIWRFKSTNIWGRYAARVLTVLVLVFGIFEMNNAGFVNQLSGVTSVFGVNTQNTQEHDGGPDFRGPRDGMAPGGGAMNSNNTAQAPGQLTSSTGQTPANNNANNTAPSSTQNNASSAAPSTAQNAQGTPNFQEFKAMKNHGEGGSVNFLEVIATYTGIMAVFVIITYYLKKLTGRRKKNKNSKAMANPAT